MIGISSSIFLRRISGYFQFTALSPQPYNEEGSLSSFSGICSFIFNTLLLKEREEEPAEGRHFWAEPALVSCRRGQVKPINEIEGQGENQPINIRHNVTIVTFKMRPLKYSIKGIEFNS